MGREMKEQEKTGPATKPTTRHAIRRKKYTEIEKG